MRNLAFYCAVVLCSFSTDAQVADTIHELTEVIVINKKGDLNLNQPKTLASLDEYLLQNAQISMIKRGGYAWEPLLNGMPTERTVTTIEGMHIFGACTDKMDPVTSYVEVSNLAEATITSGQHGSGFGATIGGTLDLKRNRTGLNTPGWKTIASTGFETNGNQLITGATLNYAGTSFYIDTDFTFRDAGNYKAGNDTEVLFSQYRKLNASGLAGFKVGDNKLIEASVIYDKATNVGYPALPMDVSLAEALITSATFEVKPKLGHTKLWQTKLYYNKVTHRMDDTGRPIVPIHMDMPGWATTAGAYSTIEHSVGIHSIKATLNSFFNISNAKMTMYPSNPDENIMFMPTWPDVRTNYTGFSATDVFKLNCHSSLKITATAGSHINSVHSKQGLESIRIFHPSAPKTNSRILNALAMSYTYKKEVELTVGGGYGERAPSVSEGYGFYLFNSFDNYDYVGHPMLANEKSLEANIAAGYSQKNITWKISASCFHIMDYIVGKPDSSLLPMTIGANGVKLYTALPSATIFNTSADLQLKLSERLKWNNQLVYSRAEDNDHNNLPFVSPLRYFTALNYRINNFSGSVMLSGNTAQTASAPAYGEDRTAAFAILNFNAGYLFRLGRSKLHTNAGIENITDAYYSTFGDWNNIPRKGRNFFINILFYN